MYLEIYIRIFKELLESCVNSCKLVILNNIPKNFTNHIYVLNIDKIHYKYVFLSDKLTPCPPDKIINPNTGKCVKIDGKICQSIIAEQTKAEVKVEVQTKAEAQVLK